MLSRRRSGRGRWQGYLSAGFLLSLIAAAAAQEHPVSPAKGPSAPGVEAVVTDDLLTLHADDALLAEVLRAIGEAGSFRVVLRGAFAGPVRESFADQPLVDAIRRLVEGHSVVVLHEDPAPASGAAALALAEIRVIENPGLVTSEEAGADEPPVPVADEGALEEATDNSPLDRETFRQSRLGVQPPTRENVLLDLGNPDQATRVAAVPKVGSLGQRAAIEVISHVFSNDEDITVRSRAVAALTRLDGSSARGLLRERAREDQDSGLRMQALNALASSRGERAINVLAQALRQDPEPRVRLSAVRALGRVGGDWARRYLKGAARDLDPGVSLAAEQALADWPEN